jgi:hypothetical protein
MRTITVFALLATVVPAFSKEKAPESAALQKVQSIYAITAMDPSGNRAVQPGSILVLQIDGVMANPRHGGSGPYWNVFADGQIGPDNGFFAQQLNQRTTNARALAVGEKVYLRKLSIDANAIAFLIQSCGTCNPKAADLVHQPYLASVSFRFVKGTLASAGFDQIREVIDQVFKISEDVAEPRGRAAQLDQKAVPTPTPGPPLKLPSTCASAQAQADQLQLNADHSFSLQEAGQSYRGTFAQNGSTLEITIADTNTPTTATIHGNSLTDSSGQTWVCAEQAAGTAPVGATLKNEDIIKMAKAGFDDAIIIAKIGSSQCQFDTSTDALIRLKQSGVSAAVLKAVVGVGK